MVTSAWTTVTAEQRMAGPRCAGCGHHRWSHGQRGCWVRINATPGGAVRRECGCRSFAEATTA